MKSLIKTTFSLLSFLIIVGQIRANSYSIKSDQQLNELCTSGVSEVENIELNGCLINRLPNRFPKVLGNLGISNCPNLSTISALEVQGNLGIANCALLKNISFIKVGQNFGIANCPELEKISHVRVIKNFGIFKCPKFANLSFIIADRLGIAGCCPNLTEDHVAVAPAKKGIITGQAMENCNNLTALLNRFKNPNLG